MVSFVRDQEKLKRIENMEFFTQAVHLFMGHRRKTLMACSKLARGKLAKIDDWPEIFERCSINPAQRPEKIGADDYIAIANLSNCILTNT